MERASSTHRHAGDAVPGAQAHSHGAVLMRYHSAPSTVLASFLQDEDELSNALSRMEDSELAQVCMLNAPAHAKNVTEKMQAEYAPHGPHIFDSFPNILPQVSNSTTPCFSLRCNHPKAAQTAGHIRSIVQQSQISACHKLQSSMQNAQNHGGGPKASYLGLPASASPPVQPFVSSKGNLIRQSSFPAEILSRLGIEDGNGGSNQDFAGNLTPHIRTIAFSTAAESMPLDDGRFAGMDVEVGHDNMRTAPLLPNGTWDACVSPGNGSNSQFAGRSTGLFDCTEPCFASYGKSNCRSSAVHVNDATGVGGCKNRSMNSRPFIDQSSLLRQSSLPANLLSQLSFDGATEKVSRTSSSGNSSEDGGPHFTSQVTGFWDEAGGALGHRKRVREAEDRAVNKLCTLDSTHGCSAENEFWQWKTSGQVGANLSGHLLSTDDSVLCRVRAKRGCATHPRSIAERVRRTKISEAIRKLQELVPNMEKQTNTATMLDEAVNYVKFLKEQVQKLSENQSKCRGTCDTMNDI